MRATPTSPGFYVRAKAGVAPDFSAVTPVLEFHVGTQRRFADWTLQLDEPGGVVPVTAVTRSSRTPTRFPYTCG
jgi:hypothetical protein